MLTYKELKKIAKKYKYLQIHTYANVKEKTDFNIYSPDLDYLGSINNEMFENMIKDFEMIYNDGNICEIKLK